MATLAPTEPISVGRSGADYASDVGDGSWIGEYSAAGGSSSGLRETVAARRPTGERESPDG